MSTRRPDFFEEVKIEKARLLPVYCAECRRISEEIPVRIARRRMFEDLAAAFAYLGVLCWLSSMKYDENGIEWAMHRLGLYAGR